MLNFIVSVPNSDQSNDKELKMLFNIPQLTLSPNKIYKLSAPSGTGKTTLLKAITNNWPYTDGIVTLPKDAKDNICFIPQQLFIPNGTLLEILTYRLNIDQSLTQVSANNQGDVTIRINMEYGKEDNIDNDALCQALNSNNQDMMTQYLNPTKQQFINEIKILLAKANLTPNSIKDIELESKNINWDARLSGGEKQRIAIIQAILTKSKFIIMDEATSALDPNNKQIMYNLIEDHLKQLGDYIVIYTDHHDDQIKFGKVKLEIMGQSLEYTDI